MEYPFCFSAFYIYEESRFLLGIFPTEHGFKKSHIILFIFEFGCMETVYPV